MSKKISANLNEEEFYVQRREMLKEFEAQGFATHPHKYEVKDSFSNLVESAKDIPSGDITDKIVQSAGRIISLRDSSSKLKFYTLESNDIPFQLIYKADLAPTESLKKLTEYLRRGDIVGFKGSLGKSQRGEPSVYVSEIVLLSPCYRVIPSSAKNSLTDPEIIYRKRYLDLLVNKDSKERFKLRSKIVHYLRDFFVSRDCIETETQMMNLISGGATAKPFITHHNELKMDLFLRVATEISLKMLVIGGFNGVFEIGKVFRNEGIDLTHNPEFTSLEAYLAYHDYNDLMNIIEELLNGLVKEIKGSESFVYKPKKRGTKDFEAPLNFSRPFKRFDVLDEINKNLNLNLDGEAINNPENLDLLLQKAKELNIEIKEPITLNRVLDAFIGEFIEPHCVSPTFITGFPICMSPLAKDDRNRPGLTERFELFVAGKELVNAYTELNIPDVQRERFLMQADDSKAGDEEAMPVDEDFCVALEYGLPPTGGLGIGIDRLVMFLTDAANIRDVILFPTMKPDAQPDISNLKVSKE